MSAWKSIFCFYKSSDSHNGHVNASFMERAFQTPVVKDPGYISTYISRPFFVLSLTKSGG